MDKGDDKEAACLDQQAQDDVWLAITAAEQVDPIADHAQKDLEDKGGEGDGRKNAHLAHGQVKRKQVEGIQCGKVAEDRPLCKVEQAERREADSPVSEHGSLPSPWAWIHLHWQSAAGQKAKGGR